jgi:hypothetical protein
MPTFQHSELLPEHEILQYKIPAATEEANQCSDPEEKQAEQRPEFWRGSAPLLRIAPTRLKLTI